MKSYDLTTGVTLTSSFASQGGQLFAVPNNSENSNSPYDKFDLTKGVILKIVNPSAEENVLQISEGIVGQGDFTYYIQKPADTSWVDIRLDTTGNSIVVFSIEELDLSHPKCSTSDTILTSNIATKLFEVDLASKKELGIQLNRTELKLMTV